MHVDVTLRRKKGANTSCRRMFRFMKVLEDGLFHISSGSWAWFHWRSGHGTRKSVGRKREDAGEHLKGIINIKAGSLVKLIGDWIFVRMV